MSGQTAMLHIRIDEAVKAEAAAALEEMGLSMSEAVRLFLRRVAQERAIPFEIKAPNARTRAAMAEAEEIVRLRSARFSDSGSLLLSLEGFKSEA